MDKRVEALVAMMKRTSPFEAAWDTAGQFTSQELNEAEAIARGEVDLSFLDQAEPVELGPSVDLSFLD